MGAGEDSVGGAGGAELSGGSLVTTEGEGAALDVAIVAIAGGGSTEVVPGERSASHAMRPTSATTATTRATIRRRSLKTDSMVTR